jgi:hypothetical protein
VASLKQKGDLAELRVATDLIARGYKVAIPYGEDWDFDLILYREGTLERVQVKFTESDGRIINVRCRSHSLTAGQVIAIKRYTAELIDWLAVYDRTTDRCYYIPAEELAEGRDYMTLRLSPPLNGQRAGVRFAEDYLDLGKPVASAGTWPLLSPRSTRGRGANGNTPALQAGVGGSIPPASTAPLGTARAHEIGAHEFRERFGYWMESAAAGAEVVVHRYGRRHVRVTAATSSSSCPSNPPSSCT